MKSLWFGLCLASCALGVQAQTTVAFSFTGNAQTWVVPANVSQVTIEAWGAQGGSAADGDPSAGGAGGLGGYAKGTLTVTPGQTLTVYVGGAGSAGGSGGYNGGGSGGSGTPGAGGTGGPAGAGGGASDVRQGGASLAQRVIVAGGGGGGGRDYWNGSCTPCGVGGAGGDGGGGVGGPGQAAFDPTNAYPGMGINGGGGAGASAGGTGGPSDTYGPGASGLPGAAGTLGLGGAGANGTLDTAAGGGGGGFYGGGGGGGARYGSGVGGGGGGGGSSLIAGLTNASTAAGSRSGNGAVLLTYTAVAPVPSLGLGGLLLLTALSMAIGWRRLRPARMS